MKRSSRMTDGSLIVNVTEWISRSYSRTTSTLPWNRSVSAFCQSTIFSGSYVAFRRSVCSIPNRDCARALTECQDNDTVNDSKNWGLGPLYRRAAVADMCSSNEEY